MKTITHTNCAVPKELKGQAHALNLKQTAKEKFLFAIREMIFGKRATHSLPKLAGLFLIGLLSFQTTSAQQLLDNFNRSSSNTVGGGWTEIETATSGASIVSNTQLQLGSNTAGVDYVRQDVSSLFNTTFSSNTGVLTWMFNMRQARPDPSGFNSTSYGLAFILGADNTSFTTGNGYAVVLGQSGSTDNLRLIRYAGGMDADVNITNIITGAADYSTEYFTVKVTYNPTGNNWSLFVETNPSTFIDPTAAVFAQIGSTTSNSTHTNLNLRYTGCFWNHNSASDRALFDNVYIPQSLPAVTTQPAVTVSACEGFGATFTAAASGSPTVKWQKLIAGVWTDIVGATNLTYTIPATALADAGQFRAVFTNGVGSVNSNPSTLTVSTTSVGGSVTSSATECSGSNSGTLNLAGQNGSITRWESSTNGGGSWSTISNVTTSQAYSNIITTTMYRAIVTNGGCVSSSSSAATITVTQPALYSVTGGGSYCSGGSGLAIGLSNSAIGYDYQLKNGASNVGSPLVGTGSSISFGLQTAAGTYTVVATDNSLLCTRTMTGSAVISINAIPTVTASVSNTLLCGSGSINLTSSGASNTISPQTFSSGPLGTTITDNSATGITSAITVSGAPATMAAVTGFSVTLTISHNNDADVEAYLVRPGGTPLSTTSNGTYRNTISAGSSVCLTADAGGSGNNYTTTIFSDAGTQTCVASNNPPFANTYRPENLFSTLTGNPNGAWTLKVLDDANGTTGTLTSWSITLNTVDGESYTWSSTPAGFTSFVQNPGAVSPTADITYLVTATGSGNGCTASATASVIVDPILTASCVVVTNASCFGAIDGSIDVTAVGGSTLYTGVGLQSGLTNGVHTFTVYDDLGCSSTCSSTITVTDALPPVISNCPADITMNNTPGLCSEIASWIDPTASDNCSISSFTSDIANGSDFYVGTTTVTYTAIDPSGNQSVCTFNVTVVDVDDPIISNCPANISVGSTLGLCGANVSFSAPTAVDNCSIASVTPSIASGSLFNIGTTTVTYTATDASGNIATCSFDVTVTDTENPVISGCPANISVVNDGGSCDAVVSWIAPTATDNCNVASFVSSHSSGSTFNVGTTTVTYTATDNSGNQSTCSFNVIVTDNELPVISNCPGTLTANTDLNSCTAIVNWTSVTATDNCGVSSFSPDFASGSAFAVGTTIVTYTAIDMHGNSATCSFNIVVSDLENPVITCPTNITVNNEHGDCDSEVNFFVTATDNCSATVVSTPTSGSTFPVGTTTVTSIATDAAGNTATCTFDVTVVDSENPVITCPANITASNDNGVCGAAVSFLVTATDNCSATVSTSAASGSTFAIGTTTVTATATDAAGNTATCSFDVTVNDTEFPTLAGCPSNISLGTSGLCSAIATWSAPTAADNCSGVVLTSTHNSGDVFPIGTTTVTYTATDAANNVTTCSFDVTVADSENPVITCPANITVNNDNGVCGAAVSFLVTATDNCSATVSTSVASGSTFAIGTTTVTAIATDAAGNTATCSFDVTVNDTEFPTLAGCPSNISLGTSGLCSAIATWSAPTAADNCSGVVLTSTHNSGDVFPIGTTTVTYTATDASGNITTCSFDVTVADSENPVITCPANITVNNDNGVCGAAVSFLVTATDNCSATVSTSVASGSTFAIGTTTVTAIATDAAGNTATCSFDVTVNDTEFPTLAGCPSNISLGTSGLCSAIATWSAPTAADNCSGVVLTSTHNSGDVFPIGTTTVTYTATDASGNITTCSFDVTVADSENPIITCPANITVNNDNGVCGAAVSFLVTATDNCSATVSTSVASGSTFAIGTTTVTAIATDAAGNTATCSFDVTVNDTEFPTLAGCPSNISLGTSGLCSAIATWSAPTAADNCSGVVLTSTHNSGDVFPIGTTTVTYTATDASGNITTCSFDVTVADSENPIITCPANITVNNDNGVCGAAVSFLVTATDNCSATVSTSVASGSTFAIGTTTVTAIATDAAGNTATCSFDVTVNDTEFPTLAGCPSNISLGTSGLCSAIATWSAPTAADNCSGVLLTSTHNSGDVFPIGTTTVTYTATDASGNITTCSFDVTVADSENPVITCPANITVSNDNGVCGAAVSFLVTATDNCSATVSTSVASGSTFAIGTTTVTAIATDAAGNTATCSFDVTVNDTEFPTLAGCPSNISLATAGLCSAIATWSAPTAADNCSGVVLTSTHNSGDVFPIGTTTVTYTATDAANNVTTCSFDVIVADNENPVLVNCPADIIICSPVVLWIAPTATDNCSAVVTSTHTPGSTFAVGTTLVTYTATDPSGNSVSCSFNVTVNVPSVAAASISSSIGNSLCVGTNDTLRVVGGSLGTTAQWVWYTASCGGVQVGTGTELIVTPSATTTYFVRAEGACGNSSCATRTITVYVGPPSGNVTLVSGLGSVCPGTTGVYSVNTVPNTGFYSWSAPAGTLINGLASPVMTPDTFVTITFGTLPIGQSGYNICVFAANDCGSTNNKCVWIRGDLGMPIYAIAPTVVCAGTTVTYTLTPLSGAVSYIWTATGGATVSGTGASVSVTFPANFTTGSLCVSGQSACGLIGAQRCISISSTPGLPGAINGLATVCPSSTGVYSIVGLVGASSYIWTVPAGATLIGPSNGLSITVSFSAAYTTGLITVKSVNTCGTQSGVRGKTVSTGKLPTPGNITGDPTSGVCGQTYQYSIPSLANATLGYVWTVPAGVTVIGPATSNSITLQFPSNFVSGQLCAAGNNSCGLGYARCINVYGNPSTPGVISGSTSVCYESVEMYTWTPVPGATYYQIGVPIGATILSGNITTNTFVLIQWGTTGGNIGLKAVNGCGVSGTRTLNVAISCRTAAEQAMSNQLIVEAYPNPNHGKFSVSIDSRTDETYTMKIMDQTGRVLKVSELKASSGMNVQEFDLDGIAAGMYMLRIETENKEVINKTILIQ